MVVPYKESTDSKKGQVAVMFNNIAHKYDFLNRVLSFGIDIWWRKKMIGLLKKYQPKVMLDIATGTGDVAIEAMSLRPEKIIGIDISEGMLSFGKTKINDKGLSSTISLELGDSEKMRFEDNSFDAVTVSFGVRNFENLRTGLTEINRVLKKGSPLVVLEFSHPETFPMKQLYAFYSKFILPVIGRMFSKDNAAYTYLPDSVKAFPSGKNFGLILQETGFNSVKWIPLTAGIVTLYIAEK